MPFPTRLTAVLALGLGLAACATTGDKPPDTSSAGRIEGAMTRPLRDLGVMRNAIPDALVAAAAAPYAVDDPTDCSTLLAEIAHLDSVLGPDLDVARAKREGSADEMLFDAFQGALDLPFRSAIRKLSGAEKRDRARAAAVLAGMVRRGWLKGVAHGAGCTVAVATP